MLRSDAQIRSPKVDSMIDNINCINTDVIARIEKELDPCDVIPMVFLLYNVPDTALQRLIIYQRVSQDSVERNSKLLYEWAMHVQGSTHMWKYEFLEALAVCQLYGVIRKLGFQPEKVRSHFLPNNIHTSHHINAMKKALYKLCENLTADNLCQLSKTLETYDIETSEYKSCELVLLELMCQKFITVNEFSKIGKLSAGKYNIDKLAKIIKAFPGLDDWADELKTIQSELNNESTPTSSTTDTSNTSTPKKGIKKEPGEKVCKVDDFNDIFSYIEQNDKENGTLKSDAKNAMSGAYIIKNPSRLGVCYIINQEKFHPSKQSIEGNFESYPLETRTGTNKDKTKLDETMSALKFEVISHDDLDDKQMLKYIKDIIKYRVQYDDSVFMLCIMSHGIKGYVFAANSVLVKIEDIQTVIDEGFKERQMEIPKVMILQMCRVKETNEKMSVKLVADSPKEEYYLHKLNFLVCWATAPELEAYRDENKGSIFIQYLCRQINKYVKQDHLSDIFTTVTDGVAKLCKNMRKDQVPTTETTLRKKLYLYIPSN